MFKNIDNRYYFLHVNIVSLKKKQYKLQFMEDIFPLKLRDWYICEEVEEEQVEKKKKVDAFQLDRGGKERWAKVCKQRRCVHGRLHPHYFRLKKFFPICLWNQLPVKSLLLFSTLLPQRAHLPSRLDLGE